VLNTGSSGAHCSSVRSLGYDMTRTVQPRSSDAVTAEWDTPSQPCSSSRALAAAKS
jgi:hypothetical protein